ncbi:MAG: hypothetical protein WDN26_12155 [Chitinophagaceae bacterium]
MVSNVPGYGTSSVAQMTFALLLELCHHVQRHSDSVMEGRWASSPDWCYWDYPLVELVEKQSALSALEELASRLAISLRLLV